MGVERGISVLLLFCISWCWSSSKQVLIINKKSDDGYQHWPVPSFKCVSSSFYWLCTNFLMCRLGCAAFRGRPRPDTAHLPPLSTLISKKEKKPPSFWDSGKNGTNNAWFCLFYLLVHYGAFDLILTWDKSPWTTLLWCCSCNKCESIIFVPGSGTRLWDFTFRTNG